MITRNTLIDKAKKKKLKFHKNSLSQLPLSKFRSQTFKRLRVTGI